MFVLSLIWILQLFFLNALYQGMKMRETIRIGESLTQAYGSENFEAIIQERSFTDGFMVALIDESGSTVGYGIMGLPPQWRRLGVDFEKLKQSFDENNTNAIHFTGGEPDRGFLVYMSRLGSPEATKYLLVISLLPPIDSTAKVLHFQLRTISMIVMAVSLIAALIWARRMSAPIITLTRSAKKLAEGDLSVEFKGTGYTEIKELADTLNYATEEISKSEVYRKELIANVSHDLRTPLALIKFYGEMIRGITGGNEKKRTEACDTIIKEADWLTEMVNEMLELSKLQQSEDTLSMELFDISACLNGIIESVNVMVERDGYILVLDIDDDLAVTGNEQGLKRAMYNLIGNALNYTGEDKRIMVRLKPAKNGIRFEVSDTGTGISEDELERVWDRYYKSGETHKRPVIGTGVGLSIVKAVLDRHDAEYGVCNSSKGGAMFWFIVA